MSMGYRTEKMQSWYIFFRNIFESDYQSPQQSYYLSSVSGTPRWCDTVFWIHNLILTVNHQVTIDLIFPILRMSKAQMHLLK